VEMLPPGEGMGAAFSLRPLCWRTEPSSLRYSGVAFLGLVRFVRSERESPLGQAAPNRVHGLGGAHVGRVEHMMIEGSKFAGLPEHVEHRTRVDQRGFIASDSPRQGGLSMRSARSLTARRCQAAARDPWAVGSAGHQECDLTGAIVWGGWAGAGLHGVDSADAKGARRPPPCLSSSRDS
jgi:hypothetical protein